MDTRLQNEWIYIFLEDSGMHVIPDLNPGITADATSDGKGNFSWRWVRIGEDFIKEDGQWKIWHYHIYGWFNIIPFYKSPYESGVTVSPHGAGDPGGEGGLRLCLQK